MLFAIGIVFLPLTTRIFSNFFDKGYIFSKIIGIALISYVVFVLGILKILPFTEITILIVILAFLILNILIFKYPQKNTSEEPIQSPRRWPASQRGEPNGLLRGGAWKIFLLEEIIFLSTLLFWSYIRAHEPSIHGLEKYMDFGFISSILRSEYFPPVDMWFPPYPINYYYFGHLVTALLTKISTIPSSITYNLMLSTIFAFTFTASFSIGANLISFLVILRERSDRRISEILRYAQNDKVRILAAGLLSAFLVSLAGNLHAIYAFFKPYVNENPVPFWQLPFALNSFPNAYWYPNATRFIHNTIHEFPLYSFVVSDLHGHFLDIPFVLLTIAILLSLINSKHKSQNSKQRDSGVANAPQNDVILASKRSLRVQNLFRISNLGFRILLLISFLLAVMYMTNAWDGIIYFGLASLILIYLLVFRPQHTKQSNTTNKPILQILPINKKIFNNWIIDLFIGLFVYLFILSVGFFVFTLPFNLFFKPFASGIGVLCAPEFLTNIGKLGPFLFEKDHCLRSPLWQLLILYGFFYFWAISFLVFLFKRINPKHEARSPKQYQNTNVKNSKRFGNSNFGHLNLFRISNFEFRISLSDVFVLILILLSTLLIIIPEFIYVKDIYPGHYRANTMFKLVYQAFIMLSISSGYIIVRLFLNHKSSIINRGIPWKLGYWIIGSIGLLLVSVYSYFAINSYYNLKTYQGLDGIKYLKPLYPTDYEAILWINKNIKGQPVILEAQGDSYTDYGRVSANTGLPTVLGWTVHEWLWRGSYDIPSPRIPEVQKMYESEDLEETKNLLKKYKVSLIFIGTLELQKYPKLNEEKFNTLGKVIYKNGDTKIYKISN